MSTHTITLLFADGATHALSAQPGQKLLEVAGAAGLTLLTDCANGQCGTCLAQCVSGNVDLDDYDTTALPDDEREGGAILCCVARTQGSAIIELPYDESEACGQEPPAQMGRVVAVTPIAEEIVQLDVEVPEPVHFLPGQYVRLKAEGVEDARSYSMANASGATRLSFYIRLVPNGQFSNWLKNVAASGLTLEVGAPRGSFFLRETERPRLFVAGGTGLAPFLAMLQHLSNEVGADVAKAPTRLLVGARSGAHLFAREALQALKRQLPSLEILYAAEGNAPEGCHCGYPTELIGTQALLPNTQIYVCGPPSMVDATRAAALQAGARKGDVLCERFA
jgi:ferredoxin-NADP reductase/ferredoxin